MTYSVLLREGQIADLDGRFAEAGVLGTFEVAVPPAWPVPLWAEAEDLGDGWLGLAWLGAFRPYEETGEPGRHWIRHEDHGWWFVQGESADTFMAYDHDLRRWLWIHREHYPWIYDLHLRAWVYYAEGSRAPRWFYNWGIQRWQSEEEYELESP